MTTHHTPVAEAPAQQASPFTGEYAVLPYTQFGLVRTFGDAEPAPAAT